MSSTKRKNISSESDPVRKKSRPIEKEIGVLSNTGMSSSSITRPTITDAIQGGLMRRIEIVGQDDHFECLVCLKGMSGEIPAHAHLQGAPHMKALKNRELKREMGMPDLVSDIASGFRNMDLHTAADSLAAAKNAGVVTETAFNILACNICGVTCTGDKPMEAHLNGESHVKKRRLIVDGRQFPTSSTNGVAPTVGLSNENEDSKGTLAVAREKGIVQSANDGDPSHLVCVVCDIPCTGEESMLQHLLGKTHSKKLQRTKSSGITPSRPSPPPQPSPSPRPPQPSPSLPPPTLPKKALAKEQGILLESEYGFECLICTQFFNGEASVVEHLESESHNRQYRELVAAESSLLGTNGIDEQPNSHPNVPSANISPIQGGGNPRRSATPPVPTPLPQNGVAASKRQENVKVYSASDSLDDLFD